MTTSDDRITQAAPVDSTVWTCAGCSGTVIGKIAADKLCQYCRPVSAASWKTPRILTRALGTWAARDDTRPDPKARAAAAEALGAIDAMQAELAALRARLVREMALDGLVDADVVQDEAPEGPPGPPAADPDSPETRMLRAIHGLCPDCDRTDVHIHPSRPEPESGTFLCCETPILWPELGADRTCPECGTDWELEPVSLGAGARIKRLDADTASAKLADAGYGANRATEILALAEADDEGFDDGHVGVVCHLSEPGGDLLYSVTVREPAPAASESETTKPDFTRNYADVAARLRAAGYNADAIAMILTDAAAAAGTGFGFDDGQLLVTAEMVGAIPVYTMAERGVPGARDAQAPAEVSAAVAVDQLRAAGYPLGDIPGILQAAECGVFPDDGRVKVKAQIAANGDWYYTVTVREPYVRPAVPSGGQDDEDQAVIGEVPDLEPGFMVPAGFELRAR